MLGQSGVVRELRTADVFFVEVADEPKRFTALEAERQTEQHKWKAWSLRGCRCTGGSPGWRGRPRFASSPLGNLLVVLGEMESMGLFVRVAGTPKIELQKARNGVNLIGVECEDRVIIQST